MQFVYSFYVVGESVNDESSQRGRIAFLPAVVQLGSLIHGEQIQVPLQLRNTGRIAVRPVRIEATCGCTVVESKLPEKMRPGDEIPVVVRFTAKGSAGNSQSAIVCSYDASGTLVQTVARIECRIEASGSGEGELQPVPDNAFSK